MIAHPEITEPLFSFLETRAGLYTSAQLARLHAELASDIDHPEAPNVSDDQYPVLRIDETGLDEHHHPIWHSRTWFPPGAMSFELMRHRSRTFVMTSRHRSTAIEHPQRGLPRIGESPPHPEQEKQA